MKHDKETYLRRIEMNLDNADYSTEKKAEILAKLRINNIDRDIECYRWKFLRKYYLGNVDSANIRFYFINERCSALVIKNQDNDTYSVTFSFIHPKDFCDSEFVADYKKWTLINYVRNKYTYKDIKARSSINAICTAYNKNRSDLPVSRKNDEMGLPNKIVPFLYLRPADYGYLRDEKPQITMDDIEKGILTKPEMFNNLGLKYNKCKKSLQESGVDLREVRYYLTFPDLNCMVIRKGDKFSVTFSFMSPKDSLVFEKFCSTPMDIVFSGKVTLINNYLDKKFTYEICDVNNSLSAVVRAFNSNRNKFPNKIYKKLKMDIQFASAFENPSNYYYKLADIKFYK